MIQEIEKESSEFIDKHCYDKLDSVCRFCINMGYSNIELCQKEVKQ